MPKTMCSPRQLCFLTSSSLSAQKIVGACVTTKSGQEGVLASSSLDKGLPIKRNEIDNRRPLGIISGKIYKLEELSASSLYAKEMRVALSEHLRGPSNSQAPPIFAGYEHLLYYRGANEILREYIELSRSNSSPVLINPTRYLRMLEKGSPGVDTHGLNYSYLKLGYSKAVKEEAENLSNLIKRDLGHIIKKDPDDWLIVFLTGKGWNHAATLLGKEIALKHNLRSVVILPNEDPLSKVYLADVDYSSIKTREQRLGKIYNRFVLGRDQAVKGKNVILIEDSLMTGATIEVLTSLLKKNGALNIYPYVLIKFIGWSDAGFEDEINRKSFKEHGIESLVKVFNDPESPRIKRLIRYSLALSEKELYLLTNRLKPEALLYLYLSAIKLFPIKMPDYLNLLMKRWQGGYPISRHDRLLEMAEINAPHSIGEKEVNIKITAAREVAQKNYPAGWQEIICCMPLICITPYAVFLNRLKRKGGNLLIS